MKTKFTLTLLLCGLSIMATAQVNLKITYDASQSGAACQPLGATKIYMHSGAGTTSPTAAWEHVIGNWGMDDGIGEMTNTGTDTWEITIEAYSYYGITEGPDSIIKSIGLVFRNEDGSLEGKDANCTDIFIRGIDGTTPTVENSDATPFGGVTVEKLTGTSINAPAAGLNNIDVFPTPATTGAVITFEALGSVDYRMVLTNTVGQVVATQQVTGERVFVPRNNLPAGMYFATLQNAEGNSATVRVLFR
jgi:hypothetical protein